MSALDQIEQDKPCHVDNTTAVIFEGSVTARRKRMEIRSFKKVSCSPAASRGLSSVQQSVFKRARPLRTSSICSLCYHSNDGDGDNSDSFPTSMPSDEHRIPFSSKLVAEFKVPQSFSEPIVSPEANASKGSGLIRSKSFPPECLHTGRCILHIRKTSRDRVVMDVKGHLATVISDEHGRTLKETPLELFLRKSEANNSMESVSMNHQVPIAADERVLAPRSNDDGIQEKQEEDIVANDGATRSPGPEARMPDPLDEVPLGLTVGNISKVSTVSSAHVEPRSFGRCPLSGKVLVCGRRREMEDTAVIIPYLTQIPSMNGAEGMCDLHFFAVFDGHGGPQASNFCANRLHHALTEELARSEVRESMSDDSEWRKVMSSCFSKMDQEVGGVCPNGVCGNIDSSATCCTSAIAPENVGTTAVVAVMSPSQIVIANCGDSRAVLSRGGVAIPVSKDHKPERGDETSRIEAAGGRVIYWDGYRVAGLLALSRALGDRYLKQYVISEPDVLCVPRAEDDECLILASDGLWDVVSNDTACDVARRCLASARRRFEHRKSSSGQDTACAQVAALLVKLAYGRGSKDNISVVVVDLKSRAV